MPGGLSRATVALSECSPRPPSFSSRNTFSQRPPVPVTVRTSCPTSAPMLGISSEELQSFGGSKLHGRLPPVPADPPEAALLDEALGLPELIEVECPVVEPPPVPVAWPPAPPTDEAPGLVESGLH